MAAANWFRYSYLAHFSRPKSVRQLYRLVKRQRFCRIVEIGISDLARSVSLVEVAQRYAAGKTVLFTGIDWFEARAQEMPPLSLKEAYRALHATGAKVRLAPAAPGNVAGGRRERASKHRPHSDLRERGRTASSKSAWFYVPRMLHERSEVIREVRAPGGEPTFARICRFGNCRACRPRRGDGRPRPATSGGVNFFGATAVCHLEVAR